MKCQLCVLFVFFLFVFNGIAFSQQEIEEKKPEPIHVEQQVELNKFDLEKNGINSNSITVNLAQSDLKRLLAVNFDTYRDFDQEKTIQIIDGPQISLYSIQYLIQKGKVYSPEFIESKSSIDMSNVTHKTIPLVNVNFGMVDIDTLK